MSEQCRSCGRAKPSIIADPSCQNGGYCQWEELQLLDGKWDPYKRLVGLRKELREAELSRLEEQVAYLRHVNNVQFEIDRTELFIIDLKGRT